MDYGKWLIMRIVIIRISILCEMYSPALIEKQRRNIGEENSLILGKKILILITIVFLHQKCNKKRAKKIFQKTLQNTPKILKSVTRMTLKKRLIFFPSSIFSFIWNCIISFTLIESKLIITDVNMGKASLIRLLCTEKKH